MRARFFLILALVFSVSSALAEEIVAPAARNVTPPGMTPGPGGDGPLIREPVPPRPPDPPRWRRYFLPRTTDAATFVVRNITIRIAGVTPPAADEVCPLADGSDWPCGRMALFALRKFLHGRAVECFFAPPGDATEIAAPCRVGKTDLGAWLLAQGWVKPNELATAADRAATAQARCARLGVWRGEARPDYCPALPEPAE